MKDVCLKQKSFSNSNFPPELEIHDVVPIQVQSREDLEAIKLLNVMHMMSLLNEGMVQEG